MSQAAYIAMAAVALALAVPDSFGQESTQAAPRPIMDGSVVVSGGVAAVGVGYLWGHGALTYQGQQLPFKVRGVDLGDLAMAHIRAEGPVYHLGCVSDFSGTYTAVSTGAAVAMGQSAAVMQNEHGVVIELESKVEGIRFNLSASRLRVTLLVATEKCEPPPAAPSS